MADPSFFVGVIGNTCIWWIPFYSFLFTLLH